MKIEKNGSDLLKQKAEDVTDFRSVGILLDEMWRTMYSEKGVGLAGNQVGRLLRVFVMDAGGFRKEFVNPVITKKTGGTKSSVEGCLSYPSIKTKMNRYKRVTVEAYDRTGNKFKVNLSGLAAVCAQHEIDHLNGKTIA